MCESSIWIGRLAAITGSQALHLFLGRLPPAKVKGKHDDRGEDENLQHEDEHCKNKPILTASIIARDRNQRNEAVTHIRGCGCSII